MRKIVLLASVLFPGFGALLSQSLDSSGPQMRQTGDPAAFRITTREVIVDVIALRHPNQPVLDLTPAELQVSEAFVAPGSGSRHKRHHGDGSSGEPGTIKSLHLIDPNTPQHSGPETGDGLAIAASCLERSALHYRLAFRPGPDGWRSGFHRVFVTTTRRDVRLYYRHQYFVGLSEPPARPPVAEAEAIKKLLMQAACYYPETPPSVSIHARLIETGRTDVLRYSVTVDANSVSFPALADEASPSKGFVERHAELDYGVCNFDNRGQPINFFHAPLVKNLNPADYARALERGFPHVLEFPTPANLGVTRIVARDRATGNLGAVNLAYARAEEPPAMQSELAVHQTEEDLKTLRGWQNIDGPDFGRHKWGPGWPGAFNYPPRGPIGSFGSIVPAPHSFCGDVYELPDSSDKLPDFRELDPIGSVYAPTLDVPAQIFENTSGIPGVTPRTNLFGIDYHGVLWVDTPGDYSFLMLSDDGAILRIDDQKVIDLDGLHPATGKAASMRLGAGTHSIEVLYYQGAVNSVALELWVRPPGVQTWRLLDLNDYAEPPLEKGSANLTQ